MSMPGPLELFIVLIIVALLFGTKKLRSLGGDLGSAIKNFRGAVKESDDAQEQVNSPEDKANVIEGELNSGKDEKDQ